MLDSIDAKPVLPFNTRSARTVFRIDNTTARGYHPCNATGINEVPHLSITGVKMIPSL